MSDSVSPLIVTIAGPPDEVIAFVERMAGSLPGYDGSQDLHRMARAAHTGELSDPTASIIVWHFVRRGQLPELASQAVLDVDALEYMIWSDVFEFVDQYRSKGRPWLRPGPGKVRGIPSNRPKQEKLF